MAILVHPFAELFPMLSATDGAALREDIGARGQRERIIILDGQILDGRNRQQQLEALGLVDGNLPPDGDDLWLTRYRRFLPGQDGDPLAFVLSLNLHRRHLTDGQRSMVAERLATLTVGRPAKSENNSANLRNISQSDAAQLLHVSERSVTSARTVRERGTPELVAKVERGEVAVSAAAELSALPVGEQLRILREQHPREFGKAVREQRAKSQLVKKERRVEREADLGARQVALPDKRYGVILADPEWQFVTYSADTGMDRSADNHYPTSPTGVIASRPVGDIAADDCVLFLWATVPMLPEAIEVMRAWGFAYRSHVVWRKASRMDAKVVLGTGYWFRNGHELLLVGVRGKVPAPAMGTQWASLVDAEPLKHSQKPDRFYDLVEAYFPSLPKIELNARARRQGWDAWGFEAPAQTHATSEAIAHTRETAAPILHAKYDGTNAAALAEELGRSVGTVRGWLFREGLTDRARLSGNGAHLGEHLKTKEGTTP